MTDLTQRARDVAGRLLECHEHNTTITFYDRDERNPDGPEAAAIISELVERIEGAWQDIETAPNDVVLVTDGGYCLMAAQNDGKWFTGFEGANVHIRVDLKPTHWMPLPQPPSVLGKQEGEG